MGLDTTHNCFHGAYSSFHRFRKTIGLQIGIELDKMEGFGGETPWDKVSPDLYPLLSHSDCDGKLTVSECKKVYRGLNELVSNFNPELPHDSDFLQRVDQFKEGLMDAINKKQQVKFR